MQRRHRNLAVVDRAQVGAFGGARPFLAVADPVVVAAAQVRALLGGPHMAMASMAPATVPDMVTSSARFTPRLTPESTRSGFLPFTSSRRPSITQSVGVPVVENRRGPYSRTRIGSESVSARLAPDRSASGA